MRSISIAGTEISDSTIPFLIAEIGHNHQGNLNTCLELIRAAGKSGASAVKLQKRNNRGLFTSKAFDAPYNSENAFGATYGEHREALEFGRKEYEACIAEAKKSNVIFFATAFDFESADFLNDLDVPAFKIASGDLRTTPLLKHIAKFGKPMILSTGGGEMSDIDIAVETILNEGTDLALLQCTAAYPPVYSELNLNVISTYRSRYPDTVIGYSGHDSGIAMSLAAYILGARVIEKHFTLNRAMKGTDHSFSLEPQGMSKLSRDLKRAHEALGDGIKRRYESEKAPLIKMSKSIYLKKELEQGQKITEQHIEFRSPGGGIYPNKLNEVIGMKSRTALEVGHMLIIEDLMQ